MRQQRHSEKWIKEYVDEALNQEVTSKNITPEEYRQYTGHDMGSPKNEGNLRTNRQNDVGKLEGERSSRNFTEQQVEVAKLKRLQEYQPREKESGKGTEIAYSKKDTMNRS